MELSLKDKNRPMLALVVLANIALYLTILNKGFAIDGWIETLTSIQKTAPVLLISILTGVINAQIDHVNKARIVFWTWSHPLPASRAFSHYATTDSRIDAGALKKHQNPLPTEPDQQNALWFKWYREFQEEAGVKQVHREYLFTRDWAGIVFLMIFGLGALALWQMASIKVASIYVGILVGQYLLVRRAAKNHGIRFVASILAYKASSD
jgi:hypothetical protein